MIYSEYLNLILAGVTAFVIVNFVIPSIIKIAEIKHLYDSPGERKSHDTAIPNLGGIAIFGAFLISYCLFGHLSAAAELQYIIAALCLVFMLGAKDDIVELTHNKKFIGQFIAALIITYFADVRLTSMYGVLGISELPYWASLVFSTITIVFIINAFNLIDGINWLASGVALIIAISFGMWFFVHGFHEYAIMSAATSGAILSFMRFNYTPARIFMGDSGSLSIGLISAVLAIVFIEKSHSIVYSSTNLPFHIKSGPAFAISVMIIPIFDTLRAFALRIFKGKSPFMADRNHIHHRLVDLGFSHIQSSLLLISTNVAFVIITYNLQFIRNAILIPLIFAAATILTSVLFSFRNSESEKTDKPIEEGLMVSQNHVNTTESVSPT